MIFSFKPIFGLAQICLRTRSHSGPTVNSRRVIIIEPHTIVYGIAMHYKFSASASGRAQKEYRIYDLECVRTTFELLLISTKSSKGQEVPLSTRSLLFDCFSMAISVDYRA